MDVLRVPKMRSDHHGLLRDLKMTSVNEGCWKSARMDIVTTKLTMKPRRVLGKLVIRLLVTKLARFAQ